MKIRITKCDERMIELLNDLKRYVRKNSSMHEGISIIHPQQLIQYADNERWKIRVGK